MAVEEEDNEACEKSPDGTHCNHWWDDVGSMCCYCLAYNYNEYEGLLR